MSKSRSEVEGVARLNSADAREVGGHVAEIVSAGLPLEAGLAAVAEEFPHSRMKRLLLGISRDLESGADLESVLASRRGPAYLSALVGAGRRTGRIGAILENFIAGARVVLDLRQMLWLALFYPLVLLIFIVPLGFFLQFYIVPAFRGLLEGFELQAPWITTSVLVASQLVTDYGLPVLGCALAALLAACILTRLFLGAVLTRRLVCRIPIIGAILRWTALARFSPLMSLLIESGVPLDEAIVLSGDACGDAEIRADCHKLAASLQAGKSLESAAAEGGRFPVSFVRALSWERNQEGLPEVLQSMADMYAARARALVMLLAAILPPLVVLLVGLVVGYVVIALVMPLLELLSKLS